MRLSRVEFCDKLFVVKNLLRTLDAALSGILRRWDGGRLGGLGRRLGHERRLGRRLRGLRGLGGGRRHLEAPNLSLGGGVRHIPADDLIFIDQDGGVHHLNIFNGSLEELQWMTLKK